MVSESHPNASIQKYEIFETIKLLLNFCKWWTVIKHEVFQWIGYEFYNTIYGHWGPTCNPGYHRHDTFDVHELTGYIGDPGDLEI